MRQKDIIIFVGAYGYDNVGDDMYPTLYRHYLKDKYELHFFNSDMHLWPDNYIMDNLSRVHSIVYGGGGNIYDNETNHRGYMQIYSDFAEKYNIPYGFSSIGVQFVDRKNTDYFGTELKEWKHTLEKASFIYCRHPQDYMNFDKGLDGPTIEKYPDLGYLIHDIYPHVKQDVEEYSVVVFTSHLMRGGYPEKMGKVLEGKKVVFMSFSKENDHQTDLMVEFAKAANIGSYTFDTNRNLEHISKVISNAQEVVTGRYHGMVFAKSYGVKVYHPIPSKMPVKFGKEDYIVNKKRAFLNLYF